MSFEDHDIEDLKPGDNLIEEGGGQDAKILFGDWLTGKWDLYADGYKMAADALVEQIRGDAVEDRLICPVLFLYRHFVELKIKQTIFSLDNLQGTKMPEGLFLRHELTQLWAYLKNQLIQLKYPDEKVRDALESIINELDQLDPRAMRFRYSHDRDLNEMPLPKSISMAHLSQTIQKVSNAFSLIEGGIDYQRDIRELEAELEAEMKYAIY